MTTESDDQTVENTLDLSQIFNRAKVDLGGKTYEIRNLTELSLVEQHQVDELVAESDATREKLAGDNATQEDAEKASASLQALARLLVVDLQEEIPDMACLAIFRFWAQRVAALRGDEAPNRAARRQTSASSSRASKRSTAATRKRGSTRRSTS